MDKGEPSCLNGAFNPSHWCLYDRNQENCPNESLILPLMGHSFMENTQSGQIPERRRWKGHINT